MQEHRPLLTRLTLEAPVRLDHEGGPGRSQAARELVELRDREDQAEMRNGHVVPVDRVVHRLLPVRRQVRDELVAAQVPVDPGVRAATLLATDQLPIEDPCCVEVVDRHRQVEARESVSRLGHRDSSRVVGTAALTVPFYDPMDMYELGRRTPRSLMVRNASSRNGGWRWRWDLNPRWACTHTRFRGVLLRPLGHATAR